MCSVAYLEFRPICVYSIHIQYIYMCVCVGSAEKSTRLYIHIELHINIYN